jgi:hypothetical protein
MRLRTTHDAAPKSTNQNPSVEGEARMDDPSIASAIYWVSWLDPVRTWAEAGVVISLAVGLLAGVIASPLSKKIEAARELELAKLRSAAAKSELELARIGAPRDFTEQQAAAIVEALKPYRGIRFEVITYPSIPEPSSFAAKLSDLLVSAGWVLVPRPDWIMSPSSGVFVSVNKNDATSTERAAAAALVAELQKAGVVAKLNEDQAVAPFGNERTAIVISVTFKP